MRNDISRAVVLNIGAGYGPSPRHNAERIIREFGLERGTELQTQVAALLREMAKFIVDWKAHSLISGTALAREFMHEQRPRTFRRSA